MKISHLIRVLLVALSSLLLAGCLSSIPVLGGGSGNTASGGAAGSSSSNKNSQLESCDKTLGTLRVFEDTSLAWWGHYRRYYPKLGSTIPVIRMMVQQSNCFVIVERGQAMKAMRRERALMNSGDLRGNSNFGGGQMVAADYTLSPSVTFEQSTLGKASGAVRRLIPGSLFGGGSVGAKSNEASTTLLMIDNRSGVQVSSSVGSAKNYDFSFSGFSLNNRGSGGASGYAKTAEGKVIIAAFADSYNQMVKALRNYKPQKVKGGLGTGGALEVDGQTRAKPKAKRKVKKASRPAKQNVNVSSRNNVNVRSRGSVNVTIDQYDASALDTYYRSLKKAVKHISQFSSMGVGQLKAMSQHTNGISLWTLLWSSSFSGDFETSKIELEEWPLDAKKKGWKILGKRIKKYNKLFHKHRKLILASKDVTKDIRNRLNAIELVTKKSLFEG